MSNMKLEHEWYVMSIIRCLINRTHATGIPNWRAKDKHLAYLILQEIYNSRSTESVDNDYSGLQGNLGPAEKTSWKGEW